MIRQLSLFLIILFIAIAFKSQAQQAAELNSFKKNNLEISAGFGPSILAEKAPTELGPAFADYFNKFRSGWNTNVEIDYLFNPYIGTGIAYDRFSSKVDADSLIVEFFSAKFAFDVSNKVVIHSVSPQIFGRYLLPNTSLSAVVNAGPAWLFYRGIGKTVADSAKFTGSSPGIKFGMKFNYMISSSFGIQLDAQFMNAFLRKLIKDNGETTEIIELEKDNYQNISRYYLSLAAIYRINLRK